MSESCTRFTAIDADTLPRWPRDRLRAADRLSTKTGISDCCLALRLTLDAYLQRQMLRRDSDIGSMTVSASWIIAKDTDPTITRKSY
jgi:hypothetical protein